MGTSPWVFDLGYFMNDLYVRVGPLEMTVLISIPLYAAIVLTVLFVLFSFRLIAFRDSTVTTYRTQLLIGKATRRFRPKFDVMQRD
ncbi:hypothetical protein JCM10296v2_006153 [Rhodotorula toruloides]